MYAQVAASDVSMVAVEDAPKEEVERERAIEMEKEDILSKPEQIRCAIHTEARKEKRHSVTLALMGLEGHLHIGSAGIRWKRHMGRLASEGSVTGW